MTQNEVPGKSEMIGIRMSTKKIIWTVVFLTTVVIVALVATVATLKVIKVTRSITTYRFASDLVAFHETHSRLPASTREFCLWTESSLGTDWDLEKTNSILRFSWTDSVHPGDQLIEFIDRRYTYLQAPINNYLHALLALGENQTNETN
jgi:hypothetical protein